MRSLIAAAVAASCIALTVVAVPATAQDSGWEVELRGWNYQSSPSVADIDNDGDDEIVIGDRSGTLTAIDSDGSIMWTAQAVPFIPAGCTAQRTPSPIDSTPAIGDLDGDGTVEIVVGMGTSWERGSHSGGVIAFSHTGQVEWKWEGNRDYGGEHSFTGDGRCEGVVSSPAIGDVNGDGRPDVVFGGFDGRVWGLHANGAPIDGFPFNTYDTIWSSPALFDVDNDGAKEIFIGGDSWPGEIVNYHQGGQLRALDASGGQVVQMWIHLANDIVASSPAIGDINGDGRADVVFGAGEYWHVVCASNIDPACPTYNAAAGDHRKVWAVDALTGDLLTGWPVSASGTVQTAPALGDLDGDDIVDVVFGSYDHFVYAYKGDGTRLWASDAHVQTHAGQPFHDGRRMLGHPIIADLDGDNDLDVAIGNELFVGHHDGRTGRVIDYSNFGYAHITAAAVMNANGQRSIVQAGYNHLLESLVTAEPLPQTSIDDAWGQFHRDSLHNGALAESWCDLAIGMSDLFCDVRLGTWYTDAVEWAGINGITTGVAPKLFAPDGTLTRAQAITFLWRLEEEPSGHASSGFDDVPAGSYYERAVNWAKATGVTTGVSLTSFGSHQPMTRAQLITMLWRLVGSPSAPPAGFTDVPAGKYYTDAVDWAADAEITTGTSATTFSPDQQMTRAQLVTMLYRWVTK